jgi:6-phosphofructokinase 1
VEEINKRYKKGKGFVNIVIAEGAHPKEGTAHSVESDELGYGHVRLGGVAFRLSARLKEAGCQADIREAVLGHIQRGGTPVAFDRILASAFGVHAFELVLQKKYGYMVSFRNNEVTEVPLEEATKEYNFVNPDSYLVNVARGLGISFGD